MLSLPFMNVWLKTVNSKRSGLFKSFATSEHSLKSPLPVIQESSRNQEVISNSEFSIDDDDDDNDDDLRDHFDSDFRQVPQMQTREIKNPENLSECLYQSRSTSEVGNNKMGSSHSSMGSAFKFSTSSPSEQIMTKRSLISDSDGQVLNSIPLSHRCSKQSQSANGLGVSNQRMTDSMRVLPAHRLSLESGVTNSKRLLTTGRKNDLREHVISIIEYCSNEVGLACYNVNTGQIKLVQIIERMTYFRTVSTVQRFYPQEIVYSTTLQNTPLIKKLMENFTRTCFRPIKRNLFDETKGYYIYTMRCNQDEINPDNKFLSFAALHALVSFLESSFEVNFNYSALNIKWHFLEELLIIHSQTIMDLEIFINLETKTSLNTFVSNFKCLTDGGTRLLRANLLQPLTDLPQIRVRQDLTQLLIDNRSLHDLLVRELAKFKHYEPITAKFIQNPKKEHIKSIKSYLGAILSLSRMCFELEAFKNRLKAFQGHSTIIDTVLRKFEDPKLETIRSIILDNFDEEILKNFENEKAKGRKENFIFLFKVDKIDDQFAEISRLTYSHTIEDVLKIFGQIKQQSAQNMKLLYNDFRGYYISGKNDLDLSQISDKIEDDIVHITRRGSTVTFSTSILVSMNNRLKQNENKLIFQSENLLLKIIKQIQASLEILFQINFYISMMDMILGFSAFVKHYRMNFKVEFCRPVLSRNGTKIILERLRTVWTMEKFSKVSNHISLEIGEGTRSLVIHKGLNSFNQLNILHSMGLVSILSQIGCPVPAHRYEGILFDTLISKMKTEDNLENKMSHFQIELSSLKNILQNSSVSSSRCLILIDELVRGSQPEQQWALSMASMQELVARQGISIALVSDNRLFKMLGDLQWVSLSSQEPQDGESKSQTQLQQCLKAYNFCPYFMELYEKVLKI